MAGRISQSLLDFWYVVPPRERHFIARHPLQVECWERRERPGDEQWSCGIVGLLTSARGPTWQAARAFMFATLVACYDTGERQVLQLVKEMPHA